MASNCIRHLSTNRSFLGLFSSSIGSNVTKVISGTHLKVPCRYNSSFFPRNWYIKKNILLRIGSGVLLAGSFCYIYIRIPGRVVQCDDHPHFNQINNIPPEGKITLDEAILLAKDLIERKKTEWGCPGIAIAVSIDGKNTWSEGFGYADLENRVPCTRQTVMRIASISKPITMVAIAKMWENGKIDFHKPVQYYLPSFPEKEVDGEKVTVTLYSLLCHMSGIRHYSKAYLDKKNDKNNSNENKKLAESSDNNNNNNNNNHESSEENEIDNDKNKKEKEEKIDEFFLKRSFKNVEEALTLFKDDPLVHKPGTKFLYTTHGWTLASAILEKASNIPFPKMMTAVFKELGLRSTCFDRNEPIVYNRARFYRTSKTGQVVNVPYVDNSYKWAGGGFLSNVGDLIKFGNAMLYSFQYMGHEEDSTNDGLSEDHPNTELRAQTLASDVQRRKSGYLKRSTMKTLWKPAEGAKMAETSDMYYGLGWSVLPDKYEHPFCLKNRFYTCHTGGGVGSSSILLILPADSTSPTKNPPKGVVIAGLANLSGISFSRLAFTLAEVFERVQM